MIYQLIQAALNQSKITLFHKKYYSGYLNQNELLDNIFYFDFLKFSLVYAFNWT